MSVWVISDNGGRMVGVASGEDVLLQCGKILDPKGEQHTPHKGAWQYHHSNGGLLLSAVEIPMLYKGERL